MLRLQGNTADGAFDMDEFSQGAGSDHDMSSCSTTASSEVASSRPVSPNDSRATASPASNSLPGSSHLAALPAQPIPTDRPYKPKFHKAALYHSNGSLESHAAGGATAFAAREKLSAESLTAAQRGTASSLPQNLLVSRALCRVRRPSIVTSAIFQTSQNVEYLKEHISKIISQNEAIMEGVEPALQKKYHKITGISRGNSFNAGGGVTIEPLTSSGFAPKPHRSDDGRTAATRANAETRLEQPSKKFPSLQQQAEQVLQNTGISSQTQQPAVSQQPLNLSADAVGTPEKQRKRSHCGSLVGGAANALRMTPSPSTASVPVTQPLQIETSAAVQNIHPQNPERSIIKSLLLNSRGLAVPTTGEGEDAVYMCPLCKSGFRSADNLQYHTKCCCQGTPSASDANLSPHSAPISPVGSPSHKYFRSNSFNLCLPEKYSPNTLKKLASSSLRHPLSLAKLAAQQASYLSKVSFAQTSAGASTSAGARNRPENIVISSSASGSTGAAGSASNAPLSVSSQCVQITKQLIDASLPSPGPLLGKTRLVDTYPSESKRTDEPKAECSAESVASNSTAKRRRTPSYPTPSSVNLASASPQDASPKKQKLLQMCGGDAKIVARKEESMPRFGSSGGSIISISLPSESMPEQSPLGIRTGLLSGGSVIETSLKKISSGSSNASSISPAPTPDHLMTPKSALSTSSHFGASSKPIMSNFFQFPPINSITAYNPLTLPPNHGGLPGGLNSNEAARIFHAGKMIPFVPGMPGPDSLSVAAMPGMSPFGGAPLQLHRSPSPGFKKIIPSSPVSIRAVASASPSLLSPPKPSSRSSPKIKPVPLSRMTASPTPAFSLNDPSSDMVTTFTNSFHQSIWSPAHLPKTCKPSDPLKKSFNFTRIAENLSPTRSDFVRPTDTVVTASLVAEYERISQRNEPTRAPPTDCASPLHIDVSMSSATNAVLSSSAVAVPTLILPTSATVTPQEEADATSPDEGQPRKPSSFLRPSSLPLKPGTFTPKRHHGITPTANTLPLISPETPRPSKHCIQLYLDGHAYTYLGLKCSTKPFYCTVNRPQPVHFTSQPKLSIYSNWQVCAESHPHPLGLKPKETMSLYDSRQRQQQSRREGKYTVATSFVKYTTLHSQSLICTPSDKQEMERDAAAREADKSPKSADGDAKLRLNDCDSVSPTPSSSTSSSLSTAPTPVVPGGYESNEEYTYVRGRGRGRFVCSECGIRCKKPSMLTKHIRTHTNVRPYTCHNCCFR